MAVRTRAVQNSRVELLLVQPEIPHNTGCAARLAAALGLPLHLVEPLGFSLEDRYLKRAGLDYWPMVDLVVHADLESACKHLSQNGERSIEARLRPFSARGGRSLFTSVFQTDDVLMFGSESRGLPAEVLERHADARVYIPIRSGVRSLNLANAISIGVYTAMTRAGLPLPDNAGHYQPHPDAKRDVWPKERVLDPRTIVD